VSGTGSRRRKGVGLVIVGMVLGAALVTPAGAHIDSIAHTWSKHFKPLAKKVFYTKKQSNGRFLKKTAKAANSEKVDGINSSDLLPGGSLPEGATIRGIYTQVAGPGEFFHAPISFGYTLPGDLATSNVHFIPAPPAANPDPVSCPGTVDDPHAAAGHACVYEKIRFNAGEPSICRPDVCGGGMRAWGGFLQASLTNGSNPGRITGAWAVTAGAAISVSAAPVDRGSLVRGEAGATPDRRD